MVFRATETAAVFSFQGILHVFMAFIAALTLMYRAYALATLAKATAPKDERGPEAAHGPVSSSELQP